MRDISNAHEMSDKKSESCIVNNVFELGKTKTGCRYTICYVGIHYSCHDN